MEVIIGDIFINTAYLKEKENSLFSIA